MNKVGEIITWQRTFTEQDVGEFGRLSGDQGIHHIAPDEEGQLMVQGLLTATLPTKIGGDLNFIARCMEFQFLLPVYTGDQITCEARLTEWSEEEKVIRVGVEWACRKQGEAVVMTGRASGVIRRTALKEAR